MFRIVEKSLEDLLGYDYTQKLKEYSVRMFGTDEKKINFILKEKINFFPKDFEEEIDNELETVGKQVVSPFVTDVTGAPTDSFKNSMHMNMSPIGGKGFYRVGEDGKLYFILKSEHYHASLGHNFPGFRLIQNAKAAGIVNTTHNNTRGYITRLLEQELVRVANGINRNDKKSLQAILNSDKPHIINRVINLETGSLGVEAGVKMMLARFYKLEGNFPAPKYSGRLPVFFVMGDAAGGKSANYHGTTIATQTMRGMWPELYEKIANAGIFEVVPLAINDIQDLKSKMKKYNQGNKKVAGFLHEIVLMNYGALTLDVDYLKKAYEICHVNDVPVLVDEIQSCIWYKELYLYRDYGLDPDFVVIGKGFSGGEYPASKILTTKEMDNLNQFGALVTNGQEELASLSYLITMEFALQNAEVTEEIGRYYMDGVKKIAKDYPQLIEKTEGIGHLLAIHFKQTENAIKFAAALNKNCIDVSAHGYKTVFLPAVLTKLPLIATKKSVDFIIKKMREAIAQL